AIEIRGDELDATLAGRGVEAIPAAPQMFLRSVRADEIDTRLERGMQCGEQIVLTDAELIQSAAGRCEIARQFQHHGAHFRQEPRASLASNEIEQAGRRCRERGLTQVKNSEVTGSLFRSFETPCGAKFNRGRPALAWRVRQHALQSVRKR